MLSVKSNALPQCQTGHKGTVNAAVLEAEIAISCQVSSGVHQHIDKIGTSQVHAQKE